nr:nucleolar and coiled-body phosphoprotein 1-like [Aegilops tauschii subsp. strangulata]
MYSMPNGEQEQEGEVSGGESGDWQSDGGEDKESEDSSNGEEVESPPCSERRSKQRQDPVSVRGKATAPTGQTSKRTQTSSHVPTEKAPKQPKVAPSKPRKALPKIKVAVPIASGAATSMTSVYKDDDDEDMEDVVTSNAAPPNVIELPDDDEDVPLRPTGRRSRTSGRKASTSKTPQSTPATEPVIQQSGYLNRSSVTFAVPLSSAQSSASTAHAPVSSVQPHVSDSRAAAADPPSSLFTTHYVPEDQKSCELGARFADLEQKQIQLNLDLELAKTNLQKAKDDAAETMRHALEKKDSNLAAAQKTTEEKTAFADQKLASVGKLEEENSKLKTALDEANKEVTRLKKDKGTLSDKVEDITRKRDELETYLGGLTKKLFLMLEEFCQNFEEETRRIETSLNPINSPIKDEAAMNVAVSRIDAALRPRETLQNDLESLMTRLNEIPGRVQEWKKSSARCSADVALSLVRVRCKEAKEEKLAAIKVANTKRLDFQSFMETFIAAATRIADGIDLDEFVEPASPPPAE